MQRERFVVKYVTANNCFAHLSTVWQRRLGTEGNAIQLFHNDKVYYLSYILRVSNNEILSLGATFARSLNIQEGDEVIVSSIKNVPSLRSITIAPSTTRDLEILEIQMERVQSDLLSQLRIVAKGQPIITWISKFSFVTFITEDLESEFSYGLLEQFTEVHVLDTVANAKIRDANMATGKAYNHLAKIFSYFSKEKAHCDLQDNAANYALLQTYRKRNLPGVFRAYPLPEFQSIVSSNIYDLILQCPCHILISRNHLPVPVRSTNGIIMCKIKKVPNDRQHANVTNTNSSSNDDPTVFSKSPQVLIGRIYVLEDVLEKSSVMLDEKYFDLNSIHSSAYLSSSLITTLKLKVGSRITIETMEENERSKPTSVDIFPFDRSITAEKFENYVKCYSRHEPLLLNSCSTIIFDDRTRCIVRMSPAECDYATLDGKSMRNLVVHVRSVLNPNETDISENGVKEKLKLDKISTRCMESILKDCKITLDLSLGLQKLIGLRYDRENILICGTLGSGKTTICKILIERYGGAPYFVHTHMIDCRSLKGKKVETMQKIITSAMNECVYYQPSILFLDDLEGITNASLNDEENSIDATNASRITDALLNTITQYQQSHYISIVATCSGISKIGSKLRPARGMQFFRTVLPIADLSKADRIDILQLTLGDKLCVSGDVNWNYYGNKTEGWMPQDLVDLTEKAKFAAWKRQAATNSAPPIVVTEQHMDAVLKNYTPMSLQGVQLYKNDNCAWSDIGGLTDAKSSLTEILQWPLKYPEIFKNAPIKLQSGVLLYGMPGTGKTMLAKAIAGECGVNLISIKGPELLSKYIGVSEESVRNVFDRARRAKPCVLFFDEFDSLASRRGHDSTGVTDRVVNQLLTQLDGVEDREGVAVVAASSRPDLLDPALLRPGRLDKCLHCSLPNEEERREILAVLCDSQRIDKARLDFRELAGLCDGFTGADINAAITQARLSAFEDALAAASNGKVDVANVKVTQLQLVESVRSTRPSLSIAEKFKYARIYARFFKGDSIAEDVLKNQKATLA